MTTVTRPARDKTPTVEMVDPRLLHPHTRNEKIYGQESVADLKEKIQSSGWIKTLVVTSNNVIISGHRRWRVAVELGMSVPVERRAFADEIEELRALLLENVAREKTLEQKTREADTWEEIYRREAEQVQREQAEHGKEGGRISVLHAIKVETAEPLGARAPKGSANKTSKASNNHRAPKTKDRVAAQAGIGSGDTYERAKKAVEAIDTLEEKGCVKEADTLRQVLNGPQKGGGANAAAKVAAMPEEKQSAILSLLASGQAKTVKGAELELAKAEQDAQAQTALTKPLVVLASWEDWLPQQKECDLLLTDPPYSTDVDDIASFAESWLPLALSRVKETGRAYVCVGAYPHELRAYLNVSVPSHLQLSQILVWSYKNTLGPSPVHDYKQNWQAILYFVGRNAPKLDCPVMNEQFSAQEINAPDGRQGNRYHAWQKPDELGERLIRHSTRPGDTVLDCFAGTGTFLLAAHRLGRIAHGCDSSEAMLHIAERRGCAIA